MITRAEADAAGAALARAESLARGREYRAVVEEFDLGFAVRTASVRRLFTPSEVGAGVLVIDRETGRTSTWPNWPADTLQRIYREKRGDIVDPPRASDAEVQLRRETRRSVAPSVAAHATVEGRVHVARGAKGDQKLNHHPLVLERLAEQTAQETVRGSERHAELIACSNALFDVDRRRALDGLPPVTLDEARQILAASEFETFQIHAPGDPDAGKPNDPCETCTYVLTQLALMPWGKTGGLYPFIAPDAPNPDPARFSDILAAELVHGGWTPELSYEDNLLMAELMAEDIVAVKGHEFRHEMFPAMADAYGQTGSLVIGRRAPGLDQRSRLFEIFPDRAAHTADLLHEFSEIIGARLFPLGRVNFESVLAIDERGRVFDLDQAGEWFVADTYLEALETLTLGKRTYRVRDDGTWGDDE
ncbi:hypothetical protein Ait01nite_074550 [Actinoplanes italicus]|uniref:YwqJ-like deaminase n=1 Tax=Actinoplanes italicus TaxID=113567 RepID=A0A2T0K0M5_9ACTN|nr:SUKH-3 domain-containing protein [Actinoplanes italicus]PRX16333.1 YwqJ-like deaminase [Actinoplanes italicus]GIE34410.1 hypothetical protein Ait01nite_074550 [Actinoplanes italicus]